MTCPNCLSGTVCVPCETWGVLVEIRDHLTSRPPAPGPTSRPPCKTPRAHAREFARLHTELRAKGDEVERLTREYDIAEQGLTARVKSAERERNSAVANGAALVHIRDRYLRERDAAVGALRRILNESADICEAWDSTDEEGCGACTWCIARAALAAEAGATDDGAEGARS